MSKFNSLAARWVCNVKHTRIIRRATNICHALKTNLHCLSIIHTLKHTCRYPDGFYKWCRPRKMCGHGKTTKRLHVPQTMKLETPFPVIFTPCNAVHSIQYIRSGGQKLLRVIINQKSSHFPHFFKTSEQHHCKNKSYSKTVSQFFPREKEASPRGFPTGNSLYFQWWSPNKNP